MSAIGSKSTIGPELGMYALRAGGHHPAESDKAITRKLRGIHRIRAVIGIQRIEDGGRF